MSAYLPTAQPPHPDWIGFLAFSIAPLVALYQGITVSLGLLFTLDTVTASVVPLVVIGLCVLARVPALRHAFQSRSISRASWYLFAYLAVLLASTLLVYLDPIERDPAKMIQQFSTTAVAALVFLVMIGAPSFHGALRALGWSLVIWAVAAILTPLSALTPLPIGEVQGVYVGSAGLRSFGVLGDGGTFVVSCLAVAFFMSRRFFWFALAMVALIISGSRSAVVIAGAGIVMALVLATPGMERQPPGTRAIRVVVASVFAGVLLVATQAVFGALAQAIGANNSLQRLGETEFTESDRYFSIVQGLEWAELSPIYGSGFNAYYFFSQRSAAFGANQSNALNQIVQTLVDGGIVALVFLGLFFLEALRPGHGMMVDRRTDPYALRIWLIAFLVLNQTAVYIGPASSLTVLVFGVAGAVLFLREASTASMRPRLPVQAPIPAHQS